MISLSEYTEGAELPNQSSKIVGVLGHQGGRCINCYIPADWDKKGRGLSAIAKFMLSIREEPFKTISAEARDRGTGLISYRKIHAVNSGRTVQNDIRRSEG